MATKSRSRSASRATTKNMSKSKETAKSTTPKTSKLTAAEYRAALGPNVMKREKIEIDDSVAKRLLKGTPEDIARQLREYAKKQGLVGRIELSRETFTSGSSKYGGRYSSTHWAFVIERPYTDEELEQEGKKLLKQKATLEKKATEKRRKEVEEYNRLAAKLGQPTISE